MHFIASIVVLVGKKFRLAFFVWFFLFMDVFFEHVRSFVFVVIQAGGKSCLAILSMFILFMNACFEHVECAPKFCENLSNSRCFVNVSVGVTCSQAP